MMFAFTKQQIHLEEQKQNCLPLFRSLELTSSDLEDKDVFLSHFYFFRSYSTTFSLQTTLRNTCFERRPTALSYITEKSQ